VNCAILQPSYIPWRGYFDQIRRADVFVFYDDVQYVKRGWRNRNRIKTANGLTWLTIPVASKGNIVNGLPIKDVEIQFEKAWNKKHLATLRQAYARAPHFKRFEPLIEDFLAEPPPRLADFTISTTIALSRELGLEREFIRSSELGVTGRKTDRLVAILERLGATHYISGPSASSYLEEEKLAGAGISFEYVDYDYPEYVQLHPPFESKVSILDLLFMAGPDAASLIR
jgi:hypothetical protein